MTLPLRKAALLATLLPLAFAIATPAAQAASGFVVAAPGSYDASPLPRELRQPPICTEKPAYPRQAYRKSLEGLTVIRVTVGPDGRIRVMTVFHASGGTVLHRDLDTAVAAALASCHWEIVSPASFDQPVDVDVHYQWIKSEHGDDF